MSILSKEEARAILDKVVKYSKAEGIEATLSGNVGGNVRYARNAVSTAGSEANISLAVQVHFGKRVGVATINEFDEGSLEKVVRRAEELAKLGPENPEFMPFLEQQQYTEITAAYENSTAQIDPEYRAEQAGRSLKVSRDSKLVAAGFLEDGVNFVARLNSSGNWGYHRATGVNLSVTLRTENGEGSGYAERDFNNAGLLDAGAITSIAADKAQRSMGAQAIEPGKYTVILEPRATADLLGLMLFGMNARNADEGRSFLSKAGGGTKMGEKLVDERVTIYSDPMSLVVPGNPWSGEGIPTERTKWIEKGVVKNLAYSRYWASKKGVKPVAGPTSAVMVAGDTSLEDLIKGTERGVLVTRFWYIRPVDPQTLLYTGLTRDGTFYIENGKIKHPVKNFRFNESPVIMLNNLETIGQASRVNGALVPCLKVRDFTFTSLSDAV